MVIVYRNAFFTMVILFFLLIYILFCLKAFRGVARSMAALQKVLPDVQFLKLDSVNIVRKFMGIFDCFVTRASGSAYVVYNLNVVAVVRALAMHWSQFVWFRFIFIVLSRFSYMNSFSSIDDKHY